MKNVALVLPSTFDHAEEASMQFISELALLSLIEEYSIKLSWYLHDVHENTRISDDDFLKQAFCIKEATRIYRTPEAAVVSRMCHTSVNDHDFAIVVLLPRMMETLNSSITSLFNACDAKIMIVSETIIDCSTSGHFSFAYKDNCWPTSLIQCLLGNFIISNQISTQAYPCENSLARQALFWVCSKCLSGKISKFYVCSSKQ